jgi:hypothetical protein
LATLRPQKARKATLKSLIFKALKTKQEAMKNLTVPFWAYWKEFCPFLDMLRHSKVTAFDSTLPRNISNYDPKIQKNLFSTCTSFFQQNYEFRDDQIIDNHKKLWFTRQHFQFYFGVRRIREKELDIYFRIKTVKPNKNREINCPLVTNFDYSICRWFAIERRKYIWKLWSIVIVFI